MNKDTSFSRKRVEEAARTSDAIDRAKAASPIGSQSARDLLGNRGDVTAMNSGRDRL